MVDDEIQKEERLDQLPQPQQGIQASTEGSTLMLASVLLSPIKLLLEDESFKFP
jgi:hypothetical protein